MDFLNVGTQSVGQQILTHVSWSLFWASLFAGVHVLRRARELHAVLGASQADGRETDALEAAHKSLPAKIERHSPDGPVVPLGDGRVDVRAALHGVPAGRRRQVRLGAVALDGRPRADRRRSCSTSSTRRSSWISGRSGWARRTSRSSRPRCCASSGTRCRARSPASIRSATASITWPSWSPGLAAVDHRHVHDAARADAGLHAQSVPAQRHHVGLHLRDARPGRRRPRRPGHRARLLRGAPREVVDHQVDDPRLDHAPPVPRASRSEPLERSRATGARPRTRSSAGQA